MTNRSHLSFCLFKLCYITFMLIRNLTLSKLRDKNHKVLQLKNEKLKQRKFEKLIKYYALYYLSYIINFEKYIHKKLFNIIIIMLLI